MNNGNDKLGNPGFMFREGVVDAWDPNDGQFFKGKEDQWNPYDRNSEITKVDGVEAYSQISSLYKGVGQLTPFVPQPGLNKETGKMPPGKFNPEPPREYVERNKMGFKPMGPHNLSGHTPLISPQATGVGTSTTWEYAVHTTVRDLKKELNIGMGSRTNKYILELDIPVSGDPGFETLNILCQATSFPQRNMQVATLWRMGRKYNLRGEVDFGGSWTLTFVDDSRMTVRKAFDYWHMDIDDSKIQGTALNGLYNSVDSKISSAREDLRNREQGAKAVDGSRLGFEYAPSLPRYQTDIKVFQLDQVGNRTMGYLMQNAFVSEISQIDYGDDQENALTKFSVTITFSEFISLMDNKMFWDIKPY